MTRSNWARITIILNGILISTLIAAPVDAAADVPSLVRELNSPQYAKRKAAADALTTLGDKALTELEKVRADQPVEVQTAIEQIIRDIRQSQTGVIITMLANDGPAMKKSIEVGDIFVAVDGHPVVDVVTLTKAEEADYRNRNRTVRVRRGDRLLDVQFESGRYGLNFANYKNTYGPDLAEGIKSFHRKDYQKGRDAFERALGAGLVFGEDNNLSAMSLMCNYYSRQESERMAWLRPLVEKEIENKQAWTLFTGAQYVAPDDFHISLQLLNAMVHARPDSGYLYQSLSANYAFKTCRYVEAAVTAMQVIEKPKERGPEHEVLALHALCTAFSELGDDADLSIAIDQLAAHPLAARRWQWQTPMAERLSKWDQSIKVLKDHVAEHLEPNGEDWAFRSLFRVYLRNRQFDAARELLLSKISDLPWIWDPLQFQVYWPETSPIWAEYGRQIVVNLTDRSLDIDVIMNALSLQLDPDPNELERALEGYIKAPPDPRYYGDAIQFWRARIAALRGKYQESLSISEPLFAKHADQPVWQTCHNMRHEIDAVRFLQMHASSLTGQRAIWLRTIYAFPTSGAPIYLLTRDHRLGRASADASEIIEIPLPEPGWWPINLSTAIIASTDGKVVLNTSQEKVFELNPDAKGWTLLTTLPPTWGPEWALYDLRHVLTDLVAALHQRNPDERRIVLPETFVNWKSWHEPIMLGDGTWFYAPTEPAQLLDITATISKSAGKHVQVYNCLVNPTDRGLFYVATEAGLFKWNSRKNSATALRLPDQKQPFPVMLLTENNSKNLKSRRFAALPEAGGAIYRLDLATGQFEREPGINEMLPPAYWRSKPLSERAALLRAAMKKANVSWPASAPASSLSP